MNIQKNILAAIFMLYLSCIHISSVAAESFLESTYNDTATEVSYSSSSWSSSALDRAAAKLVKTLVRQGDIANLAGQAVLISPHDLYDARTGLSLPFATLLREKLVAEMKKRQVRVLLPGADEEKFLLLQGVWQKQGDDLVVSLKIIYLGEDGPESIAAATEKIALKKIDPAYLTPDRDSWARYLVRTLENNTRLRSGCRLHLSPFVQGGNPKNGNRELGAYLAGWLRPALAESRLFSPLDQTTRMRGLPAAELRTRGTRGIRPDLPLIVNGPSLTADLLQADAELKGETWLHGDTVEIRAKIIWKDGTQLTAAAAEIPAHLFPAELLKPQPEPTYSFPVAPQTADTGSGISVNGLKVELTTTRGEGRAMYHNGEEMRFVIRLNRPAFVYLFDLDPAGAATLLYPVDSQGLLANAGNCGSVLAAGRALVLPEDGCSYDLVASEPYGKDTVWVVTAETPLTIPADLAGDWGRAETLIRNIRAQGMGCKDGYSEARVELVTGP